MQYNHFSLILLELVLVMGLGLTGRAAANSLDQPAVFGELLIGIILATIVQIAGGSLTGVVHDLGIFANLGAVLLLFMVGLNTDLSAMLKIGKRAAAVAAVGVFGPLVLGALCGAGLIPSSELATDLFIGMALAATSIGITARIFKDMNLLSSKEAHLVMGAAVADDVLALIMLGMITDIAAHGRMDFISLGRTILFTAIFIAIIIWFGERIVGTIIDNLLFLELPNRRLILPLIFCFGLSWIAGVIGLAAIVGAFAAGLIISDKQFGDHLSPPLRDEIAPVESIFAPVFFVLIGLQVDLSLLFHAHVFVLTLALCVVAVLGKLACALVAGREVDGLTVAISMIPRGEVGLIFAALGKSLELIGDDVFAALVITILFTTLATAPALRWSLKRNA